MNLQDVINKNLPTAAGNLLRQRLEQADKDAAEVKILTSKLETSQKTMATWQSSANEFSKALAAYQARETQTAAREAAVLAREVRQELGELKVAEASSKVALMQDLVGRVFANNRMKYTEVGPGSTYVVPQGASIQRDYNTIRDNDGNIKRTTEVEG